VSEAHAPSGDDHGHGHGHGDVSPFIQHHYDDAQHQFESGKFGIWLFLAQEVLFFSALFVAYILYRYHHPEIYSYAHKYLDVKMGAINTAVLIFSSLTAAWAVRCAQLNQKKGLILCIAVTLACACTFLVVKYFEYTHKVHEHILFGRYFDPCVSSGGNSLLTKNNECPGAKATVEWDFSTAKPLEGCFAAIAIDTDPHERGIQADCQVFEVAGAIQRDKDGKEAFIEKTRKPITNRCFDAAFGDPVFEHHDELSSPATETGHDKHAGAGFPCWNPSIQPAVCKDGWYFAWHCTGEKCTAESGGEGPFDTLDKCKDARSGKEGVLKAAGIPWVSDCTAGHGAGIVVEYGDHAERSSHTTRIAAQCKGPMPPPAVLDPLAEKAQSLELGQKAVASKKPLTAHDEKELESLGPPPEHTNMFFTIYFAMTGLHGVHVLFGVFVFIWLLIRAVKGHFTPDYFGPIDFAALYWHIVDLIWIFLFPLLYLIH
jgi:heme/copper-type cytochrome/quinol oxidase subunit 3